MARKKPVTIDAVTVVPKNERPTKYSQEKVDAILLRVSGHESLRAICADLGVPVSTFLGWVADNPDLAEQYARAKRAQAELLALEIVQIADEAEVQASYQGEEVTLDLSANAIARNRLRVDARKWVASKLLPKVYGDKLAIGGADDLPAVQQNVTLEPGEAYKRLLGGSGG
jgi:hypothetical protein